MAMRKHTLYFTLIMLFFSANSLAADHCVVLQYHHVSEGTPASTSVTPQLFQAHLDYLKQHEYKVMALEEVIKNIQQDQPLPDKCVALTIDDAYQSIYTEAWPRARQYGFPLTVFVSTKGIDRGVKAFMTWDQMREMADKGVSFQNHSNSHDHLIRKRSGESEVAWAKRMANELQTANKRISDELGISSTLFAYPYGEYNPALQAIVRSHGLVGFGQQSGPIWPAGDFGALPRFPMASVYASMKTFPTKISSIPMPLVSTSPVDPVMALDDWSPTLRMTLKPGSYKRHGLTCFYNGSPISGIAWSQDIPDTVEVSISHNLNVGRSRYNCTMASPKEGRFHWYSHNWIRRNQDGSWYPEP